MVASIAVRAGSSLKLGGEVRFVCSIPSNVRNARIEVLAYDPETGNLIYGEAGSADEAKQLELTGYRGFVLGGSSSQWLTQGGPAHCIVNLYYFGSHAGRQTYNKIASCTFEAMS